MPSFETMTLKEKPDYLAPDGSEIRLLSALSHGGFCHCTLPPGKVSIAVKHKTVEEIWYFLEGEGEVWRELDGKGEATEVGPGYCLSIPTGAHFQFRNTGTGPLRFVITTMPPWPGPDEAVQVPYHWEPVS